MVAEASKEVSKETDPKNNSSESSNNPDAGTSTPANDNRTPQIAPERAEVETDTDTTGTVYGVFLEGERIDTEVTTAETAISESENAE
jgi:hypothetical protein